MQPVAACPRPPPPQSLPHRQRPAPENTVVTVHQPALTRRQTVTPNPQLTLGLTLGLQSVDLDKSVMTCVHYYTIVWRGFTALRLLGAD